MTFRKTCLYFIALFAFPILAQSTEDGNNFVDRDYFIRTGLNQAVKTRFVDFSQSGLNVPSFFPITSFMFRIKFQLIGYYVRLGFAYIGLIPYRDNDELKFALANAITANPHLRESSVYKDVSGYELNLELA